MSTSFSDESKPDAKSSLDVDPNLAPYTDPDPEPFADPNVGPYSDKNTQ